MVKIPTRLDDILPAAAMERMLDVLQQPELSQRVRDAMGRVGLGVATPLDKVKDAWQQARSWVDSLVEGEGRGTAATLVNATGKLILGDWGGIPAASSVAYGYARASMHYQDRDVLERKAEVVLNHLVPGRKGLWVTSVREALQLVTRAEFSPRGVVMGRADAVRLPGVGDLRTLLGASVSRLVEAGAANGANLAEWSQALNDPEQILLLVSPNGLGIEEARGHRAAALQAATQVRATVVELLADGCLQPQLAEAYGFPDIRARLESGADLVIVPLNLLLGGPSGALVVGGSAQVGRLRELADALGARMDAATLSAATIALQISDVADQQGLGARGQLLIGTENLKNRATRMAIQLKGTPAVSDAQAEPRQAPLGPSPWTRYTHHSWGVRLHPSGTVEELQRRLSGGGTDPSLVIEALEEAGQLLLDLRFVHPEDDHRIVEACGGLAPSESDQPG